MIAPMAIKGGRKKNNYVRYQRSYKGGTLDSSTNLMQWLLAMSYNALD
jgi:hypothetical protein